VKSKKLRAFSKIMPHCMRLAWSRGAGLRRFTP